MSAAGTECNLTRIRMRRNDSDSVFAEPGEPVPVYTMPSCTEMMTSFVVPPLASTKLEPAGLCYSSTPQHQQYAQHPQHFQHPQRGVAILANTQRLISGITPRDAPR